MNFKRKGTLLTLSTYSTLFMKLYETTIEGGENYHMIIRGYNLMEFSAWGALLYVMPLVLLALIYCKIKNKWKSIMLMCFYLFNTATLFNATMAAYNWVRDSATGFVLIRPYMLLYAFFMLLASACLFLHFNNNPEDIN